MLKKMSGFSSMNSNKMCTLKPKLSLLKLRGENFVSLRQAVVPFARPYLGRLGHCKDPINNPYKCNATPVAGTGKMSAVDIELHVKPLREALESASARHLESQLARAALEREAESVAQIAVEAREASNVAANLASAAVLELEEVIKRQQAVAQKAEGVQSEITDYLEEAVQEARARVENLLTAARNADAAAVVAEEVATTAMRAAEKAVKDEMDASAVAKETARALNSTLAGLTGGKMPSVLSSLDATSFDAAVAISTAASLGVGTLAPEISSSPETAAPLSPAPVSQSTAAAAPAAVPTPAKAKAPFDWVTPVLAAAFLAAIIAVKALLSTPTGHALHGYFHPSVRDVIFGISSYIVSMSSADLALLQTIMLLITSVICVPLVVKFLPGGNPVLGYLLGGAIVGPHALGIIHNVHHVQHIAELGVVFLLFSIGLELSIDRLASMAKLVFGMGSVQVILTTVLTAAVAASVTSLPVPSAVILGGALAMSSTAVGIRVLEDRGELGSRFGRATFSVLLFQDLAVVVLLMLIPLLAPGQAGEASGMSHIAAALGAAGLKAALCIAGILLGGRLFVRPLYKKIAALENSEIFSATSLALVLGTSFLTQMAGLSLALGAFLAGLLIAETEYGVQVETDVAPYKGLLLGLFFMSVGMEISVQLLVQRWREILSAIAVLVGGKLAVVMLAGRMFGLPTLASLRAGLLLSPGGEFAFVAFGEAVSKGVLPAALTNQLYPVVALSMALIPYLAAFGARVAQMLERQDLVALQPSESLVSELDGHVIIAGYGRCGQLIAQLLSHELIPYVALDIVSERVKDGKQQDLPIFYGDAGSPAVLASVGAARARCAIVALDTPSANYRAVWALKHHFPDVKTYVRAHDKSAGQSLERAGAAAVVPETLEPSLKLAACALRDMSYPPTEVEFIVDDFRKRNLLELKLLSGNGHEPVAEKETTGSSSNMLAMS